MRQLDPAGSWRMGRVAPVALLLAALGLAYLPDLGHGFIKDDFMWIRTARLESIADLPTLLTQNGKTIDERSYGPKG